MEMRRVSPNQVRYAGPMQSAAVFRAGAGEVAPLHLEDFEDDLDHYQAAYFLFQEVALAVQRHDGNEPGTYTIVIDATAAKNHRVNFSTVRRKVLQGLLDLSEEAVVWSAPDDSF